MSGPFGSSQWIYSSGAAAVEGQSLRFNDDDSAYLNRTISTTGNRKTWTQSLWLKRANLSAGTPSNDRFWASSDNATGDYLLQFSSGDELELYDQNASFKTNAKYRDPSAWYHIVFALDTTQATSTDRMKLWVNGEQVTSFSSSSYPSLNADLNYNRSGWWHAIGAYFVSYPSGGQFFDGYMSEVNFTDGTAYDPTYFGETDANGQWVPKKNPSVTYGTNGFYLTFDGFNGSTASDESGNSNDWTANNLATTDLMLDHTQNNFATGNSTQPSSATLSEGNLRASYSYPTVTTGTFGMTSGKWYWEVDIVTSNAPRLGVWKLDGTQGTPTDLGANVNSWCILNNPSRTYHNGSTASYGSFDLGAGDVIGFAYDADTGELWVSEDGSFLGDPVAGTSPAFSSISGTIVPAMGGGSGTATNAVYNFGQDSSFAGNKTAQGNQDENGFGDFFYTPPSGYLALCTQNLPDPDITDGSETFNTVLYTGDGSSSRSITGVGFQPDFVWLKTRSVADHHILQDAVRGNDRQIFSNLSDAELNNSTTQVLSFDSDGFTIGSDSGVNGSGRTFASWNWKANGSGSSNTSGSITSTVSANTTAGFSIVSYTGTGSAATVGHGLSAVPQMVIVKNRADESDWLVYHKDSIASGFDAEDSFISLNGTGGVTDSATPWNNTAPTSSVFSVGTSNSTNGSSDNMIAYCFHGVEGYSKFGSYTGNGSTNGPVVYTGFRPAFIMTKRTDTGGFWWEMVDTAREPVNPSDQTLYANVTDAEYTSSVYDKDLLSNGFKMRGTNGGHNASGGRYIYMAFAENPFKYSNAR